jgi:Cd2+/Zn2+-exporting ATPase
MLLPQGNGCQACLERLESRVQAYRGIEVAHSDHEGDAPHLCVHYDPNVTSSDYVRAIATEEGAFLEWRYRHEVISVVGLDCADCARTLESGTSQLDGVLWVSVNFAAGTLSVEYDSDRVERQAIVSRIRALGYDIEEAKAGVSDLSFRVEGMDCADCALNLEDALRGAPGISDVRVDFALARLRATAEDAPGNRETIERVARNLGYAVEMEGAEAVEREVGDWKARLWRRRRDVTTVVSGSLIGLAVALGLAGVGEELVAATFVAAILVGGFYTARSGWAALRTAHSLDMNALMSIAAIGAVLIGEWAEGAIVIFLFSLGNTLEGYTMERARNAIRGLMDLSPRRATLLRDGGTEQVSVNTLAIGDLILVHPGERIAIDGVVESGTSGVNQAPITGESIPVEKVAGSEVFAGTVNGQGALTVSVSRLSSDTTIARIIRMVEEAQGQRAPSQRFVDRFARIYTPLVISGAVGIAILVPFFGWLAGAGSFSALLGEWVYRALVLLVIACPCALVISTPVSIVSAISTAARAGVLIKGGAHLEALGSVKVVCFDKTGTLTMGQPQVSAVRCANHVDGVSWAECGACRRMVADAAAVERQSEHPLAQAVVEAAEANHLRSPTAVVEAVEAVTGRGIHGRVDGHGLTVGTHAYVHDTAEDLCYSELCDAIDATQDSGHTVMVVRDDCCGVRGYIAVSDTVRPGVRETMAALGDMGIERTVMLTGDNEAVAETIGQAAGLSDVRAGLLPEQKVGAVEALLDEYGSVAMVGDGINDAPALARATVGIAMGAAGSDTALETADVALMADDLSQLPFSVRLSRRTRHIIIQNVALSLGIKALFLALALSGVATLWMAVFADVGASLIVTLNGMRMLRSD